MFGGKSHLRSFVGILFLSSLEEVFTSFSPTVSFLLIVKVLKKVEASAWTVYSTYLIPVIFRLRLNKSIFQMFVSSAFGVVRQATIFMLGIRLVNRNIQPER